MTSTGENQIDTVFEALGARGKFVIFQIFNIWIGVFPTGFQLLSNVFTGMEIDHWCARKENQSEQLTHPYSNGLQNASIDYGQCAVSVLLNQTVVHEESCPYGMAYAKAKDMSFRSEFNLVCDSTNMARLTQTLVIGGQALGALVGSLLADRVGRKKVAIVANIGLLVTGLAIAFAPNIIVFALFKFIVGAFQQALVAVNTTLYLEILTTDDRRLSMALFGISWGLAVMTLGFIAFLLQGQPWRTVQIVLSLGSLPVIIQWRYLKETLRWLIANKKHKETVELVTYAARMNGKKPADILCLLHLEPIQAKEMEGVVSNGHDAETFTNTSSRKMSYLDIFRIRRLLLNTVIMWIAWFTSAFGFFAIYLTSTTLSGNKYLNFFLVATMEIPSNIFFYFALNRYGRKFVLVCVFVTLSIGLIASGIFRSLEQSNLNSTMSLVFQMTAMAGASGCFGLVFGYTPELFPTNIRNQALGISSMMSRIGGMLAPFTGVLSEKAKWGPGVLIGCLAFTVAMLLPYIPETNGKELPQTLEELNMWFKDDKKKKEKKEKDGNTILRRDARI